MGTFRVLYAGAEKLAPAAWRSRTEAARRITRGGLSVVAVYESEDGRRFFDKTKEIAEEIAKLSGTMEFPDNVRRFVLKWVPA